MAEVVGIVASGVSIGGLAGQITASIIKLKSFWDQVQDAPADIRDLIEELEDLNYLLADIEDEQRLTSTVLDSTSSMRCLQHCKQGAARLKEVTDSLSTDLQANSKLKRKWASTMVMLKKEKIDRYKAKLERAIRLLSLSHQLYTSLAKQSQQHYVFVGGDGLTSRSSRALLKLQLDLIAMKLPRSCTQIESLPSSQDTCDEMSPSESDACRGSSYSWFIPSLFGTFKYSRRRYAMLESKASDRPLKRKEKEDITAQYRAPSWLINRVWGIHAIKTLSGWSFSPRSYNIIPNNSIVFEYIEDDDTARLQNLFAEKKASPFDCNEGGGTLLHYAVLCSSLSVCELLLSQGADVDHRRVHCFGFTPTMYAILEIAGDFSSISREDNKSEIMRLMLRESDCEIDITQYANSKEAFSLIQRHTDPLYFLRALSERVEIASKICWTSVFGASPAVFKAALGDSFDMAQLKSETDSSGRTVLHMIAMALVRIVSVILRPEWWKSYPNRYLDEAQADLQEWRNILGDLIASKPDLHHVDCRGQTPLVELIDAFALAFELAGPEFSLSGILGLWLTDLRESGVDLQEYGREEHDSYMRDPDVWCFRTGYYYREDHRGATLCVASFTFGSLPSDWTITLEEQQELYEIPGGIPGGWVEASEGEDEDQDQDQEVEVEKDDQQSFQANSKDKGGAPSQF